MAPPWRLNLPAPPVAPPPDIQQAAHAHAGQGAGQSVPAPMPGSVLTVLVAPGERVQPRQPLVVLEAMKMEHPVTSPFEAVVSAVHVAPGDRVAGGAVLVELGVGATRVYGRGRAVADPAGKEQFTSQTTITTPTYVQKPSIEKSGAIHSAKPTIAMLIRR